MKDQLGANQGEPWYVSGCAYLIYGFVALIIGWILYWVGGPVLNLARTGQWQMLGNVVLAILFMLSVRALIAFIARRI